MKILILGGTGAIGTPLVEKLCHGNNQLYVTSRKDRKSENNITYIKGNAHDIDFLRILLSDRYDVIIDFMNYKPDKLQKRLDLFLDNTEQYVFFSSARVYSDTDCLLTEESPRLLDVSTDRDFLDTEDYSLAKAKEENIILQNRKHNWTIIRPYITYNSQRLQLGIFEKENWLYRAMSGKSIVMPRDILEKNTTMTWGGDVAEAVAALIGKQEALGNIFQITTDEYALWNDILEVYLDVIEKRTGRRPNVVYADDSKTLQEIAPKYQILYDRLYDRRFNSSKCNLLIGKQTYTELKQGLIKCLNECLDSPEWRNINYNIQAWADMVANEKTSINEIKGDSKVKHNYIKYRYFHSIVIPINKIKNRISGLKRIIKGFYSVIKKH